MNKDEIALQLTLKALETGYISHKAYTDKKDIHQNMVCEVNQLMAIEIGKFYQRMLSAVRGDDDFGVQV